MGKGAFMVLVISVALAVIGLLAGFMVALLHAAEGDWGYMGIFVVIAALGAVSIGSMRRSLVEFRRTWDNVVGEGKQT